mgnify:CR=1 FL=1
MDYIVSVKGVSKSYGEVQALKDVCFEVKPGEIFGLIGPDGAGRLLFSAFSPHWC